MPDLKHRFRGADQIPAPRLWADIERRQPSSSPPAPSLARRGLIAAFALVIAIAAVALAVRAIDDEGGRRPVTQTTLQPIVPHANGQILFRVGGGDGGTWTETILPDGTGRRTFIPRAADASHPAWSPDGTTVAYVGLVEGGGTSLDGDPHFAIFLANADGSDPRRLSSGVNDTWPAWLAWSPDGTRIAFSNLAADADARECTQGGDGWCPTDIYVIDADGSNLTRLTTDLAGEFQPAWSPDGTQIAFARQVRPGDGLTGIFVMKADGTDVREIASTGQGSNFAPSWSPDGSQVVFSSIRAESWNIYLVNEDGSAEHSLITQQAYVNDAVWSPDGRMIAFVGEGGLVGGGGDTALYVMNPDGTDIAKLADQPGNGVAGDIAWQPLPAPMSVDASPHKNGQISYTLFRSSGEDIYAIMPDGSAQTQLTGQEGLDQDSSWSPDGSQIAFSSFRPPVEGSPPGVYLMNSDGTEQHRLVANGFGPSWSPNGSRVAFSRDEAGNVDIYVVNVDGSGLTRLTDDPSRDVSPTWSPDGAHLAFVEDVAGSGRDALFVMNADGSDLHAILNDHVVGDPHWSPKGDAIVFESPRGADPDGPTDIHVVHADGSGLTALTDDPARDLSPAWSPDGTKITFSSDRQGVRQIFVMNADGSGVIQVTSGPGSAAFPSWGTASPQDNPQPCDPDLGYVWRTKMAPWLTSVLVRVGSPGGPPLNRADIDDTGSALRITDARDEVTLYVHAGVPDLEHDPRPNMVKLGSSGDYELYASGQGKVRRFGAFAPTTWLTLGAYAETPAVTSRWESDTDVRSWLDRMIGEIAINPVPSC